jgi:hypothetical protein
MNYEEIMEISFKRLSPENQASFMELGKNRTEKEVIGRISSVFFGNAVHINSLRDPDIPGACYGAVCMLYSRVNHE